MNPNGIDIDVFGDGHFYGPHYIGPVDADGYTQVKIDDTLSKILHKNVLSQSLEFEAAGQGGQIGLRLTETNSTDSYVYIIVLNNANVNHRIIKSGQVKATATCTTHCVSSFGYKKYRVRY